MDIKNTETPEQQRRIRTALNETMRKNSEAETRFHNSWRDKLEKKLGKR